MTVYILKFDRPLGNPEKSRGMANYYIGYTSYTRFEDRIREHREGRAAAITRAAKEQGIGFRVVAVLWGGRSLERRLKNKKNTPKLVTQLLREGRLVDCVPMSLNQQAIMDKLYRELSCTTFTEYLYDAFDGRSINGLIRRGLLIKDNETGAIQVSSTGLAAVTGGL